jgi:hypothetical protein
MSENTEKTPVEKVALRAARAIGTQAIISGPAIMGGSLLMGPIAILLGLAIIVRSYQCED